MKRADGRLGAAQRWFRVELPSDPAMLPWVSYGLKTFLRSSGWSRRDAFRIDLAVNEAMHNAITHGNGRRADRTVELVVSDVEDGMWFDVVDRGSGFEVNKLQSVSERNRDMLEGGRGVALMLRLMDSVDVLRGPGENRVRMWKSRPDSGVMRKAG